MIDNIHNSVLKNKRKSTSNRPERVGREIKSILSDIFIKSQIHDPILFDKMILISDVIMSKDLSVAKIYVFPWNMDMSEQQLIKALNKNIPFFRKQIVKSLKIKAIPDLVFISDLQFDKMESVNEMFKLIEKK